jgi:hypothetical protein
LRYRFGTDDDVGASPSFNRTEGPMSLRTLVAPLVAIPLFFTPVACSSSSDAPVDGTDTGTLEDTSNADSEGADTSLDVAADGARDTADSMVVDSALDTATADAADTRDGGDADATPSDSIVDGDATADGAGGDASTTCVAGAIQEEACGKCGTRSRLCDTTKTWLDWGACSDETGICTPGESGSVACGRCGTRTQTCSATCAWVTGVCTGEKGCTAGSVETQYGTCLDATKVKTRTCSSTCEWSDWSDCL